MLPPLTYDPASAGSVFVQAIFTPRPVLFSTGRLLITHKKALLMNDDKNRGNKDAEQKAKHSNENDTSGRTNDSDSGSQSDRNQ